MISGKQLRTSIYVLFGLTLFVLVFVFPEFESRINTTDLTNALAPISSKNVLGTDAFGRDIFFRSLFGLRNSLSIALVAGGVTALLGTVLGISCVVFISKSIALGMLVICDTLITIPGIFFALIIALFISQSIVSIAIVLMFIALPYFVRLGLMESLRIQTEEYINSALSVGCNRFDLFTIHYLPNVLPSMRPLTIQTILVSIHIESSLSFFGIGIQPPTPSLGFMIYEARRYNEAQPSMLYFPLLLLFLVSIILYVNKRHT